jgi:methanogenic corrinoid protein MtbC1
LYAPEVVAWVRAAARAIALGHRPSQVGRASLAELEALHPRGVLKVLTAEPAKAESGSGAAIDAWLMAAVALDGAGLESAFRQALERVGLLVFLRSYAAPFLAAVGDAWRKGELQAFHEHFASERLREFLVSIWSPRSAVNHGPIAVCATLPGERHALGLHIVACVAADAGWNILFLGTEMPLPDIDACARQSDAHAVLISVSASASLVQTGWDLELLRTRLPRSTRLIVGGAGSAGLDAAAGEPVWPHLKGLEAAFATSEAARA